MRKQKVIHMNQTGGTAADLVRAATDLFARHGYRGASVRAITRAAGANLGAITYHFGSKAVLYEAVFAAVVEPSVEHLAGVAAGGGTPLDRIERVVRGLFEYLDRRPECARLLANHLAGSRPMPDAGRRTMQGNIGLLTSLIAQGQRDGSIRPGNPFSMALSVGAQPMFLSLMRRALQEGTALDQDDVDTRRDLVESVVRFVLAGLCRSAGEATLPPTPTPGGQTLVDHSPSPKLTHSGD